MKTLLIALGISFATLSCAHKGPVPPNIEPVMGTLITNGKPYLYYQYLNNSPERWRIPLSPEISGEHTCTPTNDFIQWAAYGKKVAIYVDGLEKELTTCKAKLKK